MIEKVFWEIVPGECCNLKCRGCYAANNSRPDRRIVKEEDAIVILEKLIKLGVQKIDILGGEPLLCEYLENVIQKFKSLNSEGFIGVVSNGLLLTKSRAITLKKYGLNQISISLDGTTAEVNDWSRGYGSFDKIINGMQNALSAGLNVSISYTITKENIFQTTDFIPFAEKIGVQSVGVQITEKNGRAEMNWQEIGFQREEGLLAISKMFEQTSKIFVSVSSRLKFKDFLNNFFNARLILEDERCKGGCSEFMISSGGDIVPCSLYAYGSNLNNMVISKRNANLVYDNVEIASIIIKEDYLSFNRSIRKAVKKFSTCKICHYVEMCTPLPIGESFWKDTGV